MADSNPLARKYTLWYSGIQETEGFHDFKNTVKELATFTTVRSPDLRLRTSGLYTSICCALTKCLPELATTSSRKASSLSGRTKRTRWVDDGTSGSRRDSPTGSGRISYWRSLATNLKKQTPSQASKSERASRVTLYLCGTETQTTRMRRRASRETSSERSTHLKDSKLSMRRSTEG